MAAVQGGLVDAGAEKDIKSEQSTDGWANNNNTNDGRLLSASPGSNASTGSNSKTTAPVAAGDTEDQQTLLAVLQFLRKNKLSDSVEVLRREAGLPEDLLDTKSGDSSGTGSGGAAGSADTEAGDSISLLSRVTISSSTAAPSPKKGLRGT